MASYTPLKGTLIINVQTGTTVEGDPIVKARRYQNVKTAATADAVLATGAAIAGLQQHALVGVFFDQVSEAE